jgi:prolipoprotein diacylglyceryl transferase
MQSAVSFLAYIPSPSSNGLSIGPLRLRVYGLLIALGVFAAVWLADRRWRARGGEAGTISAIAVWGVPGGLIGARIYHIVTDYQLYTHDPLKALRIWEGGLGIWGGVAGGVFAGGIYIRRHHLDMAALLDCVAPALPLAQAIGRWGNYFNQELFGRPTKLPWGVKIDLANRPAHYQNFATFHPTFLYESLWDLAVVGLVLLVGRRVRLRKGYLFTVYVALYTLGRFFTEYLRIDNAHRFFGLRLNDWVSVIVFAGATVVLLSRGRPRAGDTADRSAAGTDDPAPEPAGAAPLAGGAVSSEPEPAGTEPAAGLVEDESAGAGRGVGVDRGHQIGPGPGEG